MKDAGAWAAVLSLSLLTTTACSGGGSDTASEPPLGQIPQVTRDIDIKLPIDAYTPSNKEADDIVIAEQMVAKLCMRRFGVTWQAIAKRPPRYPEALHERLYGILDRDVAAKYGYSTPPFPGMDKNALGVGGERGRELSGAENNVLRGGGESTYAGKPVPEGGCLGEGRRRLGGSVPPTGFQDELSAEAWNASAADSRVKAVFEKWSACMKRQGFDYKSPRDSANDKRWVNSLTARELQAAKADISCKQEVNLAGIWLAVQTAYEKRLIEKNVQRLQSLKVMNEKRLKNAARVLSGQQPV